MISKSTLVVIGVLLAVGAALWVGLYIGGKNVEVSSLQSEAATCKLTAAQDRTIFTFPTVTLVDNGCCGLSNEAGPYNFALPAGSYRVSLMSYDNHPDSEDQLKEQYFVRLRDSTGIIANSAAIPDLPQSQNTLTNEVNKSANPLVVGRNATSILAEHANYPASGGANSISPVCVAFDRIADTGGTSSLSIVKLVRNLTKNEATPVNETSAVAGETVRFRIEVTNTGTANATNVLIRDVLPAGLTYIAGSTTKNDIAANDGIATGDFNVGTLAPNQKIIMAFNAKVASSASGRLTNIARTSADGVAQVQDTAFVNVPTTGHPSLSIVKLVRNLTQNEATSVNETSAVAGENVRFRIEVKNIGTDSAQNVVLGDVLPAGLTYLAGSTVVGTTTVADGITTGTIPLGTIAPGTTVFVGFNAKVGTSATGQLTNIARTSADGVAQVQDTAFVNVGPGKETPTPTPPPGCFYQQVQCVQAPCDPILVCPSPTSTPVPVFSMSLEKLGENISKQNPIPANRVDASPGEFIRFTINVRSDSNVRINNIVVRDVLPSQLTYELGSTQVNGITQPDTIITSGVVIPFLEPNALVRVTFLARAKDAASFATGTTVLINTAYARADSISERDAKIPIYVTKNILVSVAPIEGGINGITLTLIMSLLLTFIYALAKSGFSLAKVPALASSSMAPSKNVLMTIAVLLLLLAGSLTTSNILSNSSITAIEIKSPAMHTADGTSYYGLLIKQILGR